MRCQDIMTRPVAFAKEKESVQSAALRMRSDNIGFLPVLGASGEVVGVLTDRDIALRVCAENLDAAETTVEDVMTRETIACRPQDDLRRAEEVMARSQKSRILVVDDTARAVGVISLTDIAIHDRPFAAHTLSEIVRREVQPA
jgi:CBS domain-containing protein